MLDSLSYALDYATACLADLGLEGVGLVQADTPAVAWKRAGLLTTTKLMLPVPLVSHVDGALMALRGLYPKANLPQSGALLMGERARLRETVRQGRYCAGGYGRLLDCKDGRIGLNLVREDDWDLIPAWLEDYITDWEGIEQTVKTKTSAYLKDRAAELGLAVAVDDLPSRPKSWYSMTKFERGLVRKTPVVVDLSGLWAGPLASSLLQMCGARVIKVEGPNRPDGMRNGHAGFYELLNAGKDCVALDFKDMESLESLKKLLGRADVVIEASRPRAFEQLGIVAEEFVARNPGQIWARLTAYGRRENRIGFGDDIGISAGLATLMERAHGEPCFVGDAIADPVNGVHLALIIGALLRQGGGGVIDLSMVEVLRFAMGDIPADAACVANAWQNMAAAEGHPLYALRKATGQTRALGADTESVLAELC